VGDLLDNMDYPIFPILITEIHNFITDDELKKIKKVINENVSLLKKHETFGKNAKSSHEDNSRFIDLIPFIKPKISKAVEEYTNKCGFKTDHELVNSWFNIQKKDSVLAKHTHPGAIISGALFIKADSKSSKLFFHNPNPMIYFTSARARTMYNFEWVYFNPKPKTLILFPAWLQHGSNGTCNKTIDRTVVSFNYI